MTENKKRMSEKQKNFVRYMLAYVLARLACDVCYSIIKPPRDLGEYWQERLVLMIPGFLLLIGAVVYPFIQAYFEKKHAEKIEGLSGAEIEQEKRKTDKIALWVAGATCFICVGIAVFAVCRRIFKF